MRSLWHRFVHNAQHLGRLGRGVVMAQTPLAPVSPPPPRSLAARLAESMRLRSVAADPIESFPEPDPMRPTLDLSECEVYPDLPCPDPQFADQDLPFRVGRLEALLQEHQLHERSCPVRRAQVANDQGMWYVEPGECDCWLSKGDIRGRR